MTKKKTFAPVHQLLVDGHLSVLASELGVQEPVLLMLTFRFLDRHINGQPADAPAPEATKVCKDIRDIIAYIAGAILHKRYKRQKSEKMEGLRHFCSGEPSEGSLITIKSRARLTHPTKELTEFLVEALKICRGQPLEKKLYTKKMMTLEFYTGSRFQDIIRDIIPLFNKIMCHHQCNMFLEKYKIKKKCVGKGKALRTRLADKNSL